MPRSAVKRLRNEFGQAGSRGASSRPAAGPAAPRAAAKPTGAPSLHLLLAGHALAFLAPAALAASAGRADDAFAWAGIGAALILIDLVGARLLAAAAAQSAPPAVQRAISWVVGLSGAAVVATAAFGPTDAPSRLALAAGLFVSGLAFARGADGGGKSARTPASIGAGGVASAAGIARFADEFERTGHGWFWETDAEGNITYISAAFAALLVQTPEQLAGRSLAGLFVAAKAEDADPLKSERSISFYLSARMPFTEVAVRANLDSEVWWSMSGRPLHDEDGELVGFRGIGTDLSERRRAEAELWRLARYDSLTGLPNRASILRLLDGAFQAAVPGREGCSVLLIDLDGFKAINDGQGHPTGDELLCQAGKRLGELIGKTGHVGRLGGDEFQIVLPKIDDRERLAEIAEKCVRYLGIPYRINGCTFSVGASIGIASAETGDEAPEALVRRADLALYAAKGTGGGNYRFFEPEMQASAHDRQVLEHDLKTALAEGSLSLFFQPVVNTATEELSGFESLVRWDHPQQGYISPSVFIPIAEESGLIVRLGEWILRTACMEAANWPPSVVVAVNLSPIQFRDPNLPTLIVSALSKAQIPASRLELEITEGVFLSDDPKTDQTFAQLKAIGVRLALDDFGTGYSSFGYLKKAPLDKIKIDQSFVRGATAADSRNGVILKAIIDLADGLGMDTTAEGAETQDELKLVQQLGCSHVQGYVFGRPVPAIEARRIASERASMTASGFVVTREARQRLIRKGVLHGPNGSPLLIVLRNMSSSGALIECGRAFDEGTPVRLEIAGVPPIEAEVRWSQGTRVGLRFAAPVSTAKMAPIEGSGPATEMLMPNYIESGEFLNKQKAAGIG